MAEKKDALQETGTQAMARPSFIPQGVTGMEHLTPADIRLPRLVVAQGLSPQVQAGKAEYIEGLSVGMLFNDLTGEVYGRGPLECFVVRADPPRWVEFFPRDEGGGVKDLEVPPDDPRTQFTRSADGERHKPTATQFYDFVLCLWPSRDIIALSFKSAGLKLARRFNGLIAMRNAPMESGKYVITVGTQKNSLGEWPVPVINNAGWVASEEDLAYLQGLVKTLKDKRLIINREPGDETGLDEGSDVATGAGDEKSEIPF